MFPEGSGFLPRGSSVHVQDLNTGFCLEQQTPAAISHMPAIPFHSWVPISIICTVSITSADTVSELLQVCLFVRLMDWVF